MRLICPNCGAQYEVPDDVIPAEGRDVQCSDCGHTWYERPEGAAPVFESDEAAPAHFDTPEPEPEPEQAPAPPAATRKAPEQVEDEIVASVAARIASPRQGSAADSPRERPGRPPLDSSIAEILREEAAREEATRRAEAQFGIERQPDLGLDDLPPPAPGPIRTPRPPTANRTQDSAAAVAAVVAGSRRDLLPDIEEINSSLRSDSARAQDSEAGGDSEAIERRGFRRGFVGTLLVFAVLIALYVFADVLGRLIPALDGMLQAYVDRVDVLRLWLNGLIRGMLTRLES